MAGIFTFVAAPLRTDELNQLTCLTFSEPIELPTVARRWKDDKALPQVHDRLRVGVGEALVEGERAVGDAGPIDGVWIDHRSNVPTTGRVSGDGSSNASAITRIASSGNAP